MSEPARSTDYPTDAHRQADELLARIASAAAQLADLDKDHKAEADLVAQRYKTAVDARKKQITLLAKAIEKLMKTNRFVLFDSTDRVDLDNGALLFAIEDRVRRAKDMLARLEETGAEDAAYIITKAVNWEHIETWSDERLIEVGTERKREEKFSYELIGAGSKKREAGSKNQRGKKT